MQDRTALFATAFLVAMGLACAFGPVLARLAGMDAGALDLHHVREGSSVRHWLGTDELGRDLLLRLLEGGRVSLTVGIAAAVASSLIGMIIGLIAGYYGRWIDGTLMRLTDGVLALPILPVLIVLSALDLSKIGVPKGVTNSPDLALYRIILIVTLFGWTVSARLVRGTTLSVKQRDYVRAARAVGMSGRRIILRHILPNALGSLLVAATLTIGTMILTESILSFLGFGIQPPQASWGNMLTNAQESIYDTPRLGIWPGVMIFMTVIACNFVGDGLQAALNPRHQTSR